MASAVNLTIHQHAHVSGLVHCTNNETTTEILLEPSD
jgi:hypothetical protein